MRRTDKSVWILTFAAIVLGAMLVVRPLVQKLGDVDAQIDRTNATIERNLALARDRASLGHQLEAFRRRLSHEDISDDPSALQATFIRDATDVARDRGIRITGFDGQPVTRAATFPAPHATEAPHAFAATTVELTIEGHYAAVIAALRCLSHGRVPVRVEVASIDRVVDPQHPGEPLLDARLNVEIMHLPQPETLHAPNS